MFIGAGSNENSGIFDHPLDELDRHLDVLDGLENLRRPPRIGCDELVGLLYGGQDGCIGLRIGFAPLIGGGRNGECVGTLGAS